MLLLAALPAVCRGGDVAAGRIWDGSRATVGIVLHTVDQTVASASAWTDDIEPVAPFPRAGRQFMPPLIPLQRTSSARWSGEWCDTERCDIPCRILHDTECRATLDALFPPPPDWRSEDIVIRAQSGGVFGSMGRLRFDYADDFSDEVRVRGQLMTQITPQLGIDAAAVWYDAAHNGNLTRNFWTGDANLVYRVDAGRRFLMRFGGGTNYILRNGDADFGYNLTYATDFYITRPWLVSGELDWGQISGDNLLHWRVTAGMVWGSLEVYAGYDDYELGPIRFDGPVAGAGIIF